ncbi:structural maintenance of chromosome 3 (chondroitin sulfate proteoglycan 6) [Nematocida parisii]|uniref:SMC hinge domain-containing protein n=1 Tax=Nematocida parisii (strain ERTm3) TaxID=935791 RepID=I3EHT2_NEMP3|nr:hypothetical protein NEQG_00598 [Nematocida parisii ERTm3]KAI5143012.1 structural maintenance of chromosome 3 (chondroitin sulfate proteoglycan 6) [Nematocida parisii]KAI5153759.1 structural maintenance of chromosome 3 (chondroitin sulfate proteoglycan 6) [Nematocida parisii]KAI5156128.1 structural maintenance of chromosome 3 (chondroitin sulfate proteoglycan 6) [Nematocida parisii]
MRISRIALFNFKSFFEETRIDCVSEGINILIGKNGTGKSSILSAIRFVIDAHQRVGPLERRIFVNENSSELMAYVEIEFSNSNKAFPAGEHVVIRRTITQKSDEYTVDGRSVSREEMISLYETAGISKTMPYFVVEQGKIGELAQMNGRARMHLIRELAGSTVYEKDKEEIQKVLNESETIGQRIEELVKTIERRVEAIKTDKLRAEKRNEMEKTKEILIHEIYKRELNKIRIKLESLITEETSQMEDTNDLTEDALRMQLEELLASIHAIVIDPSLENQIALNANTLDTLQKKREELEAFLKEQERTASALHAEIKRLERIQESSKTILPEINILRMRGPQAVEKKLNELKSMEEQDVLSSSQNKEDLLERKRAIWKKEKEHSKKMKTVEYEMKEAERAFLSSQRAFSLGDEVRNIKGVIGYVYDLVTIPKEILFAVSSALPNYLTTIVTESVEDAISLVRTHHIEQRVISIQAASNSTYKPAVPLPSLAQYISSSEKHASLVDRLFGRIYFVSDFETARAASKLHRVAVITAAGEYFGSSGTITGGNDKSSYLFKAYTADKARYRSILEENAEIQAQKRKISEEYNRTTPESALSAPGYFEDAIFLLENEAGDIEVELLQKKTDLERISAQDTQKEIENCHRLEAAIKKHRERTSLEEAAQMIEQRLYKCAGSPEWKERAAEKLRLESKFRRIQKRILSLNVESREEIAVNNITIDIQRSSKEELVQALSIIKKDLSESVSLSEGSDTVLHDYNKTLAKLEELSHAKEKILEMQAHLEAKKEQVINITIFQVKSNFEYFFRKLTGGTACMSAEQPEALEIDVSFAGEPMVKSDELSGGQKTVIALCMILAVQRIYEAPFYLMDEFDANLDTQVLMNIINSRVFENKQLFICTFRGETLGAGNKFFCIKDSSISDISLESAQDQLCAFMP